MRIAYDNQVFGWQSHGGISRYFVRLAQELLLQNQDINVFAPLFINNYLTELPEQCVKGYKLRRYPPKMSQICRLTSRLVSQIAIRTWKPQIVHETYYSKYPSGLRSCPSVITVYDMIHELFPDHFHPGNNVSQLKRISINRADHVICISKSTRDDLIRLFDIPPEKITVIHLGFEQFYGAPQKNRGGNTDRPFLLYVGSRHGYKNFTGLLEAYAASTRLRNDFDVVALGGGKLTLQEHILIKNLGLRDEQVKQVNGGDDVLGNLYSQARAFVYPSIYEGFGLPPLEAMAHDCPVISSNTSSMPEIIGNAAEFFKPTSVDDMLRAIESVVYSDERSCELLGYGQDRLRDFSWAKCATQTQNVYQMLQG
jgi:glycosyltransferase involved in cell wall biosynthesis